jgi:hypothetical protein
MEGENDVRGTATMYWMVWSRSAKLARGPDLSMMRICSVFLVSSRFRRERKRSRRTAAF